MAASKSRKNFRRTVPADLNEADAVFGPATASAPQAPKGPMHRMTIEVDHELYTSMRRYLVEPDCPYRNCSEMVRALMEAEITGHMSKGK